MSPRALAAVLCLLSLSTAHRWSTAQDDAAHQFEDRDYMLEPAPRSEVEMEEAEHKRSGGKRLCGDQLTASLEIVCNHKYNKRNRLQAGDVAQETSWSEVQAAVEALHHAPPQTWRSRPQALTMWVRPRMRRGVFDECCAKSCTISELSSYCQD